MTLKQKLLAVLLVIGLVIGGYCVYMETHFTFSVSTLVNITDAQILEEMPDIAVSERDEALQQAILAIPGIQDGLRETAGQAFTPVHVRSLAPKNYLDQFDKYLPEDWTKIRDLTVSHWNNITLEILCSEQKAIIYQFFADGRYPTHKTIGVYRSPLSDTRPELTAIYETSGGVLTKAVDKHLWFAWLHQDE